MCWCHYLRPGGWLPVGSSPVLNRPFLGSSGSPLATGTLLRGSGGGCPGEGCAGGQRHSLSAGLLGREGSGQIYSLCLPQSLLGSLLVPPDLPRTSLLAPAPVLSMEVLFSSARALSHPPDLLQEPPPSLLPILTQAAPHRGRQSDTHQAGVLPAAPGTAR